MIVYDLYLVTNGDQPVILLDREKILFEGNYNHIPEAYMRRLINHVGIGFNRSRFPVLTVEIL